MNDNQMTESIEKQKKLQAISKISSLLHTAQSAENLCNSICTVVNQALRYPEKTVVRLKMGETSCSSSECIDSPWKLKKSFTTSDKKPGYIEIVYLSENAWIEEAPFSKEYKSFIENISLLISDSISRQDFEQLLLEYVERNKELIGLDRINQILSKDEPYEKLLYEICQALPASWQYPENTEASLTYGEMVFSTSNFKETPWMQIQHFKVPGGAQGKIEICYTHEYPQEDEGPFLKEERTFINNISHLISVALGCKIREYNDWQSKERLKELKAINQTTAIIMKGNPVDSTLQSICNILPDSWQYPEHAVAKITFEGREYVSRAFKETPYVQREQFITFDNQIGTIEIYYLVELPDIAEGPFLKEERELICNIARLIAHYVNNQKGRQILHQRNSVTKGSLSKNVEKGGSEDSLIGKSGSRKADYVIRNVLVISSSHDAYLISAESHEFRQLIDPIHHNNLWHLPNIVFSSSIDSAEEHLKSNDFDIIFIIATTGNQELTGLYKKIRYKYTEIQIYLIAKSHEQIVSFKEMFQKEGKFKTEIFAYNDNPRFIILLCKLCEDLLNSSQIIAPSILLVEDSPEFYTPVIISFYKAIFSKYQKATPDHNLKYTTRMRILLTCNYEDAIYTTLNHAKSLIAVFSDVEFPKGGSMCNDAGFALHEVIHEHYPDLNIILQSTEQSFAKKAKEKGIEFLYKNTLTYYKKITEHIDNLNTISFYSQNDNELLTFNDFESFLIALSGISQEDIVTLAQQPAFLNWLKAQGLFNCVGKISRINKDNQPISFIYNSVIGYLNEVRFKKNNPTIIKFNSRESLNGKAVTTVSTGSLGGKGRNIAFLYSLTSQNYVFSTANTMKISIPVSLIIRTDEHGKLLEQEQIVDAINSNDFQKIQSAFNASELSEEVMAALRIFIEEITEPLAVRSSSLFEDSAEQPFAGAFETYIIPNNSADPAERLQQLVTAIKRIYASPFKPEIQQNYHSIGKKAEDDRMAIVLQNLIGMQHDSYYYPQISGVAGSYNFYPVGHMQPEDGYAVLAFGLGYYVVEGRGGYRFSPAYPGFDFGSIKDIVKGSQAKFYAVDLNREHLDFTSLGEKAGIALLDIDTAEEHGTLTHCASIYDFDNDRITSDLRTVGPKVLNFADILKFDYIPLANTLRDVLTKLSNYMGSPVEIEFAVKSCKNDPNGQVLHLLQVRPLTAEEMGPVINLDHSPPEKCLIYSQTSLGNATINSITDIVMIKIEDFNPLKTEEMVKEVEYFNNLQRANRRSYIIIGPGRWGTRDKSIGIPVTWAQISNAKVVVELGMNNFPLEASLGSHFFHNITVMKTGYIAVNNTKSDEFINWNALNTLECVQNLKYFKLLRSDKPLLVQLDGRNKRAIIAKD